MSQNKKDPSDCLKNKRQKNKKQKNKKNLATGTTPGACFWICRKSISLAEGMDRSGHISKNNKYGCDILENRKQISLVKLLLSS